MQIDIQNELKKIKNDSDHVAFKIVKESTRDLSVRNEIPQKIQTYEDYGVMIEVMRNGHIGYAATCELNSESIQNTYKKAVEMTSHLSQHAVTEFNSSVRPPSKGHYISKRTVGLDQLSLAEAYDFLKTLCKELRCNSLIKTAITDTMIVETEHHYVSSSGADFLQNFNLATVSLSSTAVDSRDSQTRTFHGGRGLCLQAGKEYFDLSRYLNDCQTISKEAIELLKADNCPDKTCDLILSPDQMLLQIHESIGHPLELDRILGDERNFAGWSFVSPDDFGQLQYGSSLLDVTFDPFVDNQFASYNFDEIGNPAEKKFLIEKGLLKAGLGSLESQFRSGLPGVANSRSMSWNRAPIDRMANINVEPGTESLEELISRVDDGIIMFSNRSWSIDDYRRKFQFGCEYAKEIKNGQIGRTLKNPNYRGITVPFWNSLAGLTHAGTIEKYGSPYCGKGEPSQIIRVGHSSPYALFKNIDIFGA